MDDPLVAAARSRGVILRIAMRKHSDDAPAVVVGAGPAGLTAAIAYVKRRAPRTHSASTAASRAIVAVYACAGGRP
jgi:succinate dehydrogenase/fumarate reductase flavoprotein subunit